MKYLNKFLILFLVLLFGTTGQQLWAQLCSPNCPTLDLSLVDGPNNLITLQGCANGSFQAADGTDDWSNGVVTIRIPAGNPSFPISVSAPSASSEVTFVNSGNFAGMTFIPAFNNPGIITFTLDQVGGMNDGYIYMQFVDEVDSPNVPLSDGSCVNLLQIDFPDAWSCPDCVELVDPDQGGIIFTGTRTGNDGIGGDADNLLDGTANLPIELTTFDFRVNRCDLALYWETATEKDFGYYQIEASKDGQVFTPIGQKKPESPNSASKRIYKHPLPPQYHGYYFRLKAVDLDGTFEYSKIIYTEPPCEKQYNLQLYPNPNYLSELTVEISSPEAHEQIRWFVLDSFGKQIQTGKTDLKVGSNKLSIATEQLPSGTYYIQIIGVEQLRIPAKFIRSNF